MDERDFVRNINRYGVSILDCFIFDETGIISCAMCNKQFSLLHKLSPYQHFIDSHLSKVIADHS